MGINTALELRNLCKIQTVNSLKEKDIAMKMSFYATKRWIWEKNTKELLFLNH